MTDGMKTALANIKVLIDNREQVAKTEIEQLRKDYELIKAAIKS